MEAHFYSDGTSSLYDSFLGVIHKSGWRRESYKKMMSEVLLFREKEELWMRLGRACPFTSPMSDRRGVSPLSMTLVGIMPSLEVTGAIRSNPSTNSTLFGQTISTGLDHLLVRPAYVSNTQGCRNRNSRKKKAVNRGNQKGMALGTQRCSRKQIRPSKRVSSV